MLLPILYKPSTSKRLRTLSAVYTIEREPGYWQGLIESLFYRAFGGSI